MLGETVGSYRITGALSSGGMGAVYRGEHALLGQARPRSRCCCRSCRTTASIVARFFNEARATTAIQHPGIVEIFDFGYATTSERAYIVMELLDGESLRQRLADARTDAAEPSAIGSRARSRARSAAAHAPGIVHRDLKPDNVFLVRDPRRRRRRARQAPRLRHREARAPTGPRGPGSVRTRRGRADGHARVHVARAVPRRRRRRRRADSTRSAASCSRCWAGAPPFIGEGAGRGDGGAPAHAAAAAARVRARREPRGRRRGRAAARQAAGSIESRRPTT